MVFLLALMVASILFCLLSTSTALGVTKKILRTAGTCLPAGMDGKKAQTFASPIRFARVAPKKHCEVKKNNPKISMKFSGQQF